MSMKSPWKSVFRDDLLNGKVALVTGGGTGIGRSIALELASIGATVIIASRNEVKCQESAERMNEELSQRRRRKVAGTSSNSSTSTISSPSCNSSCLGRVFAGPSTSIRMEEEVEHLISEVVREYKSLDILVNNAGGQFVCPAEDLSANGFSSVVDTNLKGTFLCCQKAYHHYMKDHGGSIVNITLGNRNGMPNMVHSGAARSGIENMTATLCAEWMESNIRINCVRPGIIWTESGFQNYGDIGEEYIKKLLPHQPAKRFGTPEEISSAVTFLCSEGASYITGAILCVDGGSAYHFLPLIDIEDKAHLPVYGNLPKRAML